jgi:hypothetical protein
MHPLVRNLYKRFVIIGRDYPVASPYVKDKAKLAFQKNSHLSDEVDIKRAVARGRWMCRELVGVIQLKKYRAMRHRYTAADGEAADPMAVASAAAASAAQEKFGV